MRCGFRPQPVEGRDGWGRILNCARASLTRWEKVSGTNIGEYLNAFAAAREPFRLRDETVPGTVEFCVSLRSVTACSSAEPANV